MKTGRVDPQETEAMRIEPQGCVMSTVTREWSCRKSWMCREMLLPIAVMK